MILVNSQFDDLNAVRHMRACVNYYGRILNLTIFQKNSPNCQIKNLTKVSRYTVDQVFSDDPYLYGDRACTVRTL